MSELSDKHDDLVELRLRITELERSLEESLSRTSSMIEAFDGLVYICSKNYEVEFANKWLIERTGYNPAGQKCYKALHDLDKICPWCVNDRVFKGETVRWEVRSPKDNNWYYIVNTPIYHTDGSISKLAMSQDITERKRMEERLRKAYDELEIRVQERTAALEEANKALQAEITERRNVEKRLMLLSEAVENAPDCVQIVDLDGYIIYSSRAAEDIYGFSREELIGRHVNEMNADPEFASTVILPAIKETGRWVGEIMVKHKNGRMFPIWLNASIVKDSKGEPIAMVGINRDITERRKMEEMRLENDRLVYIDKVKSEILTIMSHELRTPLTSVIGYSIILKEKKPGKLNKKQEFLVENILTSSKHLLDIINNVLDLAKIEVGKLEIVIEYISVPDTINEILNLMQEKAANHNVILKKEFDPELPFIKADIQKFKQILFNLLVNAIKFSKPAGGTVTVTTKKEGNTAKFSVSDTGIGIREEDISRLFRVFEQLDKGLSRKYEGTGLGLAITKQLVEMQGGKIMVESKYGKGSTFSFLLLL